MASLAQIGSILFVCIIMAAEKSQTQHCGGQQPISGLYADRSIVCYVQAVWPKTGCTPYDCPTFSILKGSNNLFDGLDFYRITIPGFGKLSKKYILKQLNQDFTTYDPDVDEPVAQVLATVYTTPRPPKNPSGPKFVHSIVYKNYYGLIACVCAWDKETELIDAFICTFERNATASQVKELKKQADKFKIKPMVTFSQANCG